jgi:hypothetical protein
MKNAVLRDVAPCGFIINYSQSVSNRLALFLARGWCTLKGEAVRSSETSDYNKPTRLHIPEDGILHVIFVSRFRGPRSTDRQATFQPHTGPHEGWGSYAYICYL